MRKVVVNGKTYRYRMHRRCVEIFNEDEVRMLASFSVLTHTNWRDVELAVRKNTLQITPKMVAKHIEYLNQLGKM